MKQLIARGKRKLLILLTLMLKKIESQWQKERDGWEEICVSYDWWPDEPIRVKNAITGSPWLMTNPK